MSPKELRELLDGPEFKDAMKPLMAVLERIALALEAKAQQPKEKKA